MFLSLLFIVTVQTHANVFVLLVTVKAIPTVDFIYNIPSHHKITVECLHGRKDSYLFVA